MAHPFQLKELGHLLTDGPDHSANEEPEGVIRSLVCVTYYQVRDLSLRKLATVHKQKAGCVNRSISLYQLPLILGNDNLPDAPGHFPFHQAGVPVLFLTARAEEADRITGLESGGDDYLGKPFSLRELLLRVAAILKRYRWYEGPDSTGTLLRFGGNEVDFRTYVGTAWDGRRHELTHKEAMILKLLTECEGEVVSRERVLDVVWGYEVYPSTRTIDNFILRLRKRFERDSDAPLHFHTVRGVGYRFTKDPGFTP